MKKPLISCFALATCLLGIVIGSKAWAHHSFAAEFDANSETVLEGVVIKIDWTNPHTYLYIEVETDDGGHQEWALEMGSPNGLARRGWKRNTLAIGDEIKVKGSLARDGSHKANAQVVLISATCERLFAGTSQRDFDETAAGNAGECEI